MMSKMKNFRNLFFILIATSIIGLSTSSCNKRDYPCPGLGKSNEADLSMFDENGQLKSEKDKGLPYRRGFQQHVAFNGDPNTHRKNCDDPGGTGFKG